MHFDKHQMERYEYFKRSRINKLQMKKVCASLPLPAAIGDMSALILNGVLGMQLVDAIAGKAVTNPNVLIALCGVTKMYVGELIETARLVATNANYHGPLMPVHVYEAYHMMQTDKKSVSKPKRARLFR